MEALGFNLVGYGCVTCIGNSGPLPIEISKAVNEADLAVTAVLSGNRNFEGRISPDVKMNYLASPPLVVAYAIAGTMDHDFETDSLGKDTAGNDVFLKDIWPTPQEIQTVIDASISSGCSRRITQQCLKAIIAGSHLRLQQARYLSGMRNQHMFASLLTLKVCQSSQLL